MRQLARMMVLAVVVSVALASGHAFAWTVPDGFAQTLAKLRARQQAQEAARLKAELAQVRQQLEAVMAGQRLGASLAATTLPHLTLGGLTPSRILTPNPQNYWLRFRQPQTGNTWSFLSQPSEGLLSFGADGVGVLPEQRLRMTADGTTYSGPLVLDYDQFPDRSPHGDTSPDRGPYDCASNSLTFLGQSFDPIAGQPVEVRSTLKLETLSDGPGGEKYGYNLQLSDTEGYPWVQFVDAEPNWPGKEVYINNHETGSVMLNLMNENPGDELWIRYINGDLGSLGQWLCGVSAIGQTNALPGDFCIIRDWMFKALGVNAEDGRVMIGGVFPPDSPRADGRLHVKGRADETQLVVEADSTQTADILRVRDTAGTNYLAVTGTGDTAVGASSQPRSIVLYDIADGSIHYLRVNNDQLELVSP